MYRLNQPSDGHDSIAFVWLRHMPHSYSPNLKRTGDTPDPSRFLRFVIVKDVSCVELRCQASDASPSHCPLGAV